MPQPQGKNQRCRYFWFHFVQWRLKSFTDDICQQHLPAWLHEPTIRVQITKYCLTTQNWPFKAFGWKSQNLIKASYHCGYVSSSINKTYLESWGQPLALCMLCCIHCFSTHPGKDQKKKTLNGDTWREECKVQELQESGCIQCFP